MCLTADTSAKLILASRYKVEYILMNNRRESIRLVNSQNAISLAMDYSTQEIYYSNLPYTEDNALLIKFKMSSLGFHNTDKVSI